MKTTPERYNRYFDATAKIFVKENENTPWLTRYLTETELIQEKNFAMDVYDDRYVLIAGGEDYAETLRFAATCMYDMQTHTFKTLPDLPCWGPCVGVVLNGWFYVYFKYFSLREFKPFYRLKLTNLSIRSSWSHIPNPDREPGLIHGVVTDGTKLYVFGVVKDTIIRDIFFCYDPDTNLSTELPSMMTSNNNNSSTVNETNPPSRTNFAYAMVPGKVYVFGGMINEKPTSSIHVFDVSKQLWNCETVPPLPGPLLDSAATVFMKRWIVITGGKYKITTTANSDFSYSTKLFILDTLTNEWMTNDAGIKQECHGVNVVSPHLVSIGSVVPRSNANTPFDLFGNKRASMKIISRKHIVSNWDIVGCFILVRYLVEKGRACPNTTRNYGIRNDLAKDGLSPRGEKNIIEQVMTHLSIDMFKVVLSFLMYN